jgi:hypothetical protein
VRGIPLGVRSGVGVRAAISIACVSVTQVIGATTGVPINGVPRAHASFIHSRVVGPPAICPRVASSGVRPSIVAPVAVLVHVRVKGVRLVLVLLGIRPEVLGSRLLLLGLLAKPGSLYLRFLGVSLGMHGPRLVFARLKVSVLRFPADLRCVLAVLLIALLPERLPALAAGHQKHRNECDDNDYNDDPNPGTWVHSGSTSLLIQHVTIRQGPVTRVGPNTEAGGRLN